MDEATIFIEAIHYVRNDLDFAKTIHSRSNNPNLEFMGVSCFRGEDFLRVKFDYRSIINSSGNFDLIVDLRHSREGGYRVL